MRNGDTKLFGDRQKLENMVFLRRSGISHASLAVLFGCDISSIRSQCEKYGIEPWPWEAIYEIKYIAFPIIRAEHNGGRRWRLVEGERINRGFSYEEYLKQSKYPFREAAKRAYD